LGLYLAELERACSGADSHGSFGDV
jgi:hypothetical protein